MTAVAPTAPHAPTNVAALDRAVAALRERGEAWARLPIVEKLSHLDNMCEATARVAERWVAEAVWAKGIPAGSPLAGEEWLSGPWAVLYALKQYARTLRAIANGGRPAPPPGGVRRRPGGQIVARVFPTDRYDRLLQSGVSAEVWLDPAVDVGDLPGAMGAFYRQSRPEGRVALVLGAGNIASIAPLDVLHKLLAEGQVCVLKMNPVNEYLGPLLEEVFGSLIAAGFVRIVYGGAAVGAALCEHPGIDEIHITGSAATHDAIVFGTGEEGVERKRRNAPRLGKRVTSELGNVSPTIVVPGDWSAADLRHQAATIVSQKFHNAGANCVAAQVLVLPEGWDRTAALLDAVRAVARSVAPRAPYYPGAADRHAALLGGKADVESLDPRDDGAAPRALARVDAATDAACFREEVFGPVLAWTTLPGRSAAEFLANAARFCNERLWGTLGANLLIDPATARGLGPALEGAIEGLRYGSVAVNGWTGIGFLLAQTSWGAFPGHTPDDIGSGIGQVHNTFLFDRPQRSVVHAPFRALPRSLARGDRHLAPKPLWFVTNRRAHTVGRRLVAFERDPGPRHLPGIVGAALRG